MPCCIIQVGGPCTLDMLSIFMPCGPPTAWTPPGPHRGHLDPSNLRLPQVRLCACEALRGRGSDLALAPISTLELAQQLPSVRNCQVRGVRHSADRGGGARGAGVHRPPAAARVARAAHGNGGAPPPPRATQGLMV